MIVPVDPVSMRFQHGVELHEQLVHGQKTKSEAERFVLDLSIEDLRDLTLFTAHRFKQRQAAAGNWDLFEEWNRGNV